MQNNTYAKWRRRIHRRKFIILIGFSIVAAMGFLFSQFFNKRKIKNFVKSVLHSLKPIYDLPEEGQYTSIETALNSRCNSDYEGNPEKYHWGIFDTTKKLSSEQIKELISLAKIPRFTDQKVEIQSKRNILTFVIQNQVSGILRDWIMVESGMQQQAVGLVCAALGVGMAFRNLGKDGTSISDTDYGTIKIRLDPMKPTYNGSFWSNLPPGGRNPWLKGNLTHPVRDGGKPLLAAIANLGTHNKSSRKSTEQSIGQLLWAARGRTPHYFLSRPWGMTIPTAHGKQNTSCVYLISENKVYRYVNWHKNRPTHSLELLSEIVTDLQNQLIQLFTFSHFFIVIGVNEISGIALWEVGYQLLNLLLQAHSLDVAYEAFLMDETHKAMLSRMPIKDPIAVLALKTQSTSN